MSNLVEAIIFAILGAVVLGAGIITSVGWEIMGLGTAITVFAIVCIIMEICKKK